MNQPNVSINLEKEDNAFTIWNIYTIYYSLCIIILMQNNSMCNSTNVNKTHQLATQIIKTMIL